MHFAQYFDTFLSFSFDLIHVPGVMNILPDQLSRLYPSDNDIEQEGGGVYDNRPDRKRFMLKKLDPRMNMKTGHRLSYIWKILIFYKFQDKLKL
jgi:hypothetical protein